MATEANFQVPASRGAIVFEDLLEQERLGMLLLKLAYFAFAAALFLMASYPFRNEMRNSESFYANLRRLQKEKRKGTNLLGLAFGNLMLSAIFFLFSE